MTICVAAAIRLSIKRNKDSVVCAASGEPRPTIRWVVNADFNKQITTVTTDVYTTTSSLLVDGFRTDTVVCIAKNPMDQKVLRYKLKGNSLQLHNINLWSQVSNAQFLFHQMW